MKNKSFLKICLITLLLLSAGCGRNHSETASKTDNAAESDASEPDAEKLLDAFLEGEIPAIRENGTELMFDQLPQDEEDWSSYFAEERTDLDNDGESELIVNGPYGGIYFDARDGKVYVLAEGEGTTGILSYVNYDNATWIVHSDTSHMGRQMYWLTRYHGDGNIADEFLLGAEYWDAAEDKYDENSDFTYRGESISMEEYETLKQDIFGR